MTYRDRRRLNDIRISIEAIHAHLEHGDLTNGLVYDAVRIRMLEIGEASKSLSPEIRATQGAIPWKDIARTRDLLAHRYFDTAHAILQTIVDHDLPELARALDAMLAQASEDSS
jgi:uncharacterized protein with HEPN domain